jgi:hypothetical protein
LLLATFCGDVSILSLLRVWLGSSDKKLAYPSEMVGQVCSVKWQLRDIGVALAKGEAKEK